VFIFDSGSQPFLTCGTLKPRQSPCGTLQTQKTSYGTLKSKNPAFLYEFQSFKKFDGTLGTCLRNTSVPWNSGWEPLIYDVISYFVSHNVIDVYDVIGLMLF
jgi:hypothetical protein